MERRSLHLNSLWRLRVALSFLLFGCAAMGGDYIVPDYKEFTTGGIFVDKYWSGLTGGKNVKLEGNFVSITTEVIGQRERLAFYVRVPEGLSLVTVHAGRSFAPQLYELKPGDRIVIYGQTRVVRLRARVGGGFGGDTLVVELHKIEKI